MLRQHNVLRTMDTRLRGAKLAVGRCLLAMAQGGSGG